MSEGGFSVLSDTACQLGEGPSYDPGTDILFWFSILEKKLLEKKVSGGTEHVHDLPVMASALAVIDAGRQLIVTETGLQIRDVKTGRLSLHIAVEADNPSTRSNDARVHPCGALWFGTMGRKAEHRAGSIYWYFKGEVRKLFPDITVPNSICFSPDGATAYFTDTRENILYRVECDRETGLPTGERKVFHDHRGKEGGLDGSVVDAEGVLWNACWGGNRVDAYSPEGNHLRSFALPAKRTSCPAFVGKNADRLAVTSAWEGMTPEQRKAEPDAGKTFLLDVKVNGRLEPRVRL
jgi:sugar lactone lactonase YvrE